MRAKSNFPGVPRQSTRHTSTELALIDIAEQLTGQRGKGENRALLLKDLATIEQQIVRSALNKVTQFVAPTGPIVEPPTAPKGVTGIGGFTFIAIQWEPPTYKGHAYAEIHRSETNSLSAAVIVGREISDVFSDTVDMGVGYYYWVFFVNEKDEKGPPHDATGLFVETQKSAEAILEEIGGLIEQSHLGAFLSESISDTKTIGQQTFDDLEQLAQNLIAEALTSDVNADRENTRHAITVLAQRDIVTEQQASSLYQLALSVRINESSAFLANNYYTSATTDHAIAAASTTLNTKINGVSSDLSVNYYTRSSTNYAISSATTTLKSQIESPNGSSVGASLQQLAQTVATNDEQWAMWGVKTTVNKLTSSFGLVNDGSEPIFAIKGAKFAIITSQDPTNLTPVFSVLNGKTVMKSALIDEAHIKSLVADVITAGVITATARLTTPSINYNPVTGARSNNFSLSPAGNMVAKNIDVSGRVTALSGNIGGAIIVNGVLKVGKAQIDQAYISKLFGVDASFSGTIYAKNIEGDVTDAIVKYFTSGTVRFTVAALPFIRNIVVSNLVHYHAPNTSGQGGVSGSSSATFTLKAGSATQDVSSVTGNYIAGGALRLLSGALFAVLPANTTRTYEVSCIGNPVGKVLIQAFKNGSTIS